MLTWFRKRLVVLAIVAPIGAAQAPGYSWDDPSPTATRLLPNGQRIVVGEVLMGLEHGVDPGIVPSVIAAMGGEVVGHIPELAAFRLRFDDDGIEDTIAERLRGIPGVRYASVHGICQPGGLAVEDTFFDEQWHLFNAGHPIGKGGADIEAIQAWQIEKGSPEVVVAVLDSGVNLDHPEFEGRLMPGYDFVNEDAVPEANEPHGTYVTGLLAANTGNGFGVAGVDWHCSIMPIKVIDEFGRWFDIAQGLVLAANSKTDVINMSLQGIATDAQQVLLQDALGCARASGAILVACGGNFGVDTAEIMWPGASPSTMAIGWTTSFDNWFIASSTGATLDFVAPGNDVVTVSANGTDTATLFSGCSAATPIVSGIIALMKAHDPTLRQEDAYNFLQLGAEDQVGKPDEDTPGWDPFHGHGRVNAYRSLRALCECTGDDK